MSFSFSESESKAVSAVAKAYGKGKLDGQTEGRTKHIHALVIQSYARHGQNVPKDIVIGEVKRAVYRDAYKKRAAKYGIFAPFIPIIIQFVEALAPIVIQMIKDWLGGLVETQRQPALMELSIPAKTLWAIDE